MTTVVLGLDGAGFELLDDWLGDPLDNLDRIQSEGISADLEPCYPPVTCPNWQCYAKSMNPGKLGVFWWEHIDTDNHQIENRSASGDFDGDFFWDYLGGQRAIVNLPTSFPPTATHGKHVAGGPGADQSGFTSPTEFENHLESEYGYRVHPEKLNLLNDDDSYNECVDEIQELIKIRFDVLMDLIESGEYEFVHLSIFYINMLQHFYYDHDVVRETWEIIDKRIGELLDSNATRNLFIMSDHGSNQVESWFRVNSWLEQEGYLVRERGISDWLNAVGVTSERARSILGTLGIEWWARRIVPERVQRTLPDSEGTVDRSAKGQLIDWEQSVAIASGQGPLYILSNDESEKETIRSRLINELECVTSPNGEPICDDVFRSSEVYSGDHVESGPDLVIDQASGVHIDGGIGAERVFSGDMKWNGENTMSGVFMAVGEDIGNEFSNDRISITDIGPTVLHLHGCSIPSQMDGLVLNDAFAEESDARDRAPAISSDVEPFRPDPDPNGAETQVSERLENLGYLE